MAALVSDIPFADRQRVDRSTGRLVGSRCEACGAASWPARAVCERCGSAHVVVAEMSTTGKLVTFTTVHVSRAGLPAPYVLGQVDLPDGVRIVAHGRGFTEAHRVPMPVRLVLADAEDAVPPFYFEPMDSERA